MTSAIFEIDKAKLHYEVAGSGQPLVFIHAGVADSRQWNNEFQAFSETHLVVRFDQRGYGRSKPVEGEYSRLNDLTKLIAHLELDEPPILIGCSMGGGTAIDYALENPQGVKALVLVDSAPAGLKLDIPPQPKFKLVAEAEEAGDLELACEIETQIWFDGDRPTAEVDPAMRQLLYEMNLQALRNDAEGLGTYLHNLTPPAMDRIGELQLPVLGITGASDTPYMLAAAKVMAEKIANIQQVTMADAAHLPNMDQPEKFAEIVRDFIESLPA